MTTGRKDFICRLTLCDMDINEDLALLLGMLCGDGCLSIKHNGDKNRIYPITFVNTNKQYVDIFYLLFNKLFGMRGHIYCDYRLNKKPLWKFEKYSKKIYLFFVNTLGIPNGKKAPKVFMPEIIKNATSAIKKHFFLGLLITDGGIRRDGSMIFHSASKRLIHDMAALVEELWGFSKPVREYLQRERFLSYQLNLNRSESERILSDLPASHNLVDSKRCLTTMHRHYPGNCVSLES